MEDISYVCASAMSQKPGNRFKSPTEKMRSLALRSMASKIGYLHVNDLIAAGDEEAGKLISGSLPGRLFAAGEQVFPLGDPQPMLMFLRLGAVDIYHPSQPGRLFVKRLEPGALFGEMKLLGQTMYGSEAEAPQASEIVLLTVSDIDRIDAQCPGFGLRLACQIGPRVVEAERKHEVIAFQTVPMRLASLLLDLAGPDGEVRDVTQQELADQLGVYRETVSVTLAGLKQAGLIHAARRRVKLLDPEGLRGLVPF
jgi:CRP/FNR family cyclic AMP-dependent transcriptional regulator